MANPYFGLIDDSDPSPRFVLGGTGFVAIDTSMYNTNFKGTQKVASPGGGSSTATYTFTGLPNSTFDVWSTWNPWNFNNATIDAATNVPYSIYNNNSLLQNLLVNQYEYPLDDGNNPLIRYDGTTPLPPWDIQANGSQWRKIGTFAISSGTLKVVITDGGTGNKCWADAIRVTQVIAAGPCTTPLKFADNFSNPTLSDDWHPLGGAWAVNFAQLSQTSNSPGNKKISIWSYEWNFRDRFEINARILVDNWDNMDVNCQMGVSLHMDSNGYCYSLCFRGGVSGTDRLSIIDDFGGSQDITFSWSPLNFYLFRFLRVEDQLYGKVWLDGTSEPTTWTITQTVDNATIFQRTGGYPGLTSGLSVSSGSFDNVTAGPLTIFYGCTANNLTPPHSTLSSGSAFAPSINKVGSLIKSIIHPTISSAGVRIIPAYHATATKSTTHPTISSTSVFIKPKYQASLIRSTTHPSITSAGTRVKPIYTASCAKSITHPTITSAGVCVNPVRTATSSVSATHPTMASAGVSSLYHAFGVASLAAHTTITAAGGELTPNYAGTTILVAHHPTLSITTTYFGPSFNSIPLFLRGTIGVSWSGYIETFIAGKDTATGTAPLYIAGRDLMSNVLPLYLFSPTIITQSVNLVVAAEPIPISRRSLNLTASGSPIGSEGMISLLPLSITGWDNPPYKSVNLSIKGMEQGGISGVLNLTVTGGNPTLTGTIPLYIENKTLLSGYDLYLYIKGEGITPGAIPVGSALDLYVQRGPNGGIYLYIENKWIESSLTLFIAGHPTLSNQTTLFVEGMGDTVTSTIPLSIPQVSSVMSLTAQMTLAIPDVIGRPSNVVPLFIVGWTS